MMSSNAMPAGAVQIMVPAGLIQAVTALERFARSVLPVIADVIAAAEPVVVRVAEKLADPEVQGQLRSFAVEGAAFAKRVEEFESAGYAPYFAGLGKDRFSSQLDAYLVWRLARGLEQDELDRRAVLKAFQKLRQPRERDHWGPADLGVLLADARAGDILPEAFRSARRSDLLPQFVSLLEAAEHDTGSRSERLIEISAVIAPHVRTAKGRLPRFETFLHLSLLYASQDVGGRSGYTFGLVPENENRQSAGDGDPPEPVSDFLDDATAATRAELSRPQFNPTAARQALRKYLASKASPA